MLKTRKYFLKTRDRYYLLRRQKIENVYCFVLYLLYSFYYFYWTDSLLPVMD